MSVDLEQQRQFYDESWIDYLDKSIPGLIQRTERRLFSPNYPMQYVHYITEAQAGKRFISFSKHFEKDTCVHVEAYDGRNYYQTGTMYFLGDIANIQVVHKNLEKNIYTQSYHGTSIFIDHLGNFAMQSENYKDIKEDKWKRIVHWKNQRNGRWIDRLKPHFESFYELNPTVEGSGSTEILDGHRIMGNNEFLTFHLSRDYHIDNLARKFRGRFFHLDFRVVGEKYQDTVYLKDVTSVGVSRSGVIRAINHGLDSVGELKINPDGEFLAVSRKSWQPAFTELGQFLA